MMPVAAIAATVSLWPSSPSIASKSLVALRQPDERRV
jgi:hypothetical protein